MNVGRTCNASSHLCDSFRLHRVYDLESSEQKLTTTTKRIFYDAVVLRRALLFKILGQLTPPKELSLLNAILYQILVPVTALL